MLGALAAAELAAAQGLKAGRLFVKTIAVLRLQTATVPGLNRPLANLALCQPAPIPGNMDYGEHVVLPVAVELKPEASGAKEAMATP